MKIDLEHVPCDLCGSEDAKLLYRKPDDWLHISLHEYDVVRCRGCGLVYVDPRPTHEAMRAFYPADYHEHRTVEENRVRYERQARFLPDLNGLRMLDIGCARGDFLLFLESKYPRMEGVGVDPFSRGVNPGRFRFVNATLENAGLHAASFDVVTAWAVMEHVATPSVYLAEVARLLKPGGIFVFLVTNADSLYGRVALLEDVPRHLYHFSRTSVRGYARRFGFKEEGLVFDDGIFDGRAHGAIIRTFERLLGTTWRDRFEKRIGPVGRIARRVARLMEKVLFRYHWEASLGVSGIMISTFRKTAETEGGVGSPGPEAAR